MNGDAYRDAVDELARRLEKAFRAECRDPIGSFLRGHGITGPWWIENRDRGDEDPDQPVDVTTVLELVRPLDQIAFTHTIEV